jgi:hypothetical protein
MIIHGTHLRIRSAQDVFWKDILLRLAQIRFVAKNAKKQVISPSDAKLASFGNQNQRNQFTSMCRTFLSLLPRSPPFKTPPTPLLPPYQTQLHP